MERETGVNAFLGKTIEIAMVVSDYRIALEELNRAGIGPWRVYTIGPENTTDQTYRGKSEEFTIKACFAEIGDVVWEVIQPVSGSAIFQEFLDRGGQGLHHVAYDCCDIPFPSRIEEFQRRGYELVQSGNWADGCHFAFFTTGGGETTCLETIAFATGWEYPEPDEQYPFAPQYALRE